MEKKNIMQRENIPWEMEEEILSWIPPKPLARFKAVCKRWNALFNESTFINKNLAHARPQFILLAESKICSVDVNLDGPSIEVHNLPSYISDEYVHSPPHYTPMRIEYCDGLLIFAANGGLGICSPWLGHIKWIKSGIPYRGYNGMGYDNTSPEKHYKIFESDFNVNTLKGNIIELSSNAWKPYEVEVLSGRMSDVYCSVSLNGNLYWIACRHFKYMIQSFDFSTECFKPYCNLPGSNDHDHVRALAAFKGDRFSVLEQDHNTRNMEIWVTKDKIKNGDGEAVEWMKFMHVLVPKWSVIGVSYYPPSYFIDDKSRSLVLCSIDEDGNTCIYVAKGDKFHEFKIDSLVGYATRHRTYFPSFVPIPSTRAYNEVKFTMHGLRDKTQTDGYRYARPRGVEASDGVGVEWDDGFFDNVKKISIGVELFVGVSFVKFDYSMDKAVVLGAAHGNATHISDDHFSIDDDDYIEAVEGTYSKSHITSLKFWLHKNKVNHHYGFRSAFERSFVLRGGGGSKIIGFYGRSSNLHLTALGVHFNNPTN